MLNSAIPTKMAVPFANSGEKQTIPVASQIGISSGRASFTDGFPPLTRTPLTAGGIPPYGTDFNGILNAITSSIRWSNAGGAYSFDSDFSSSVGGYPKGALLSNSINSGYWFNTTDANTANPENTNASLTGWVPAFTYGTTDVTGLAAANVTLTALQAANERITLAGVLTANINLIFPAWSKSWTIVNNCTGAFSVTCKTPSGTGIAVAAGATVRIIGNGTNIISNESPLIAGALQKSANLSEIKDAGPAAVAQTLANLGLSDAFTASEIAATPWVNLTLLNAWTTYPDLKCAYRKVLGLVFVEVNARNGTFSDGTILATLPVGYRPAKAVIAPVLGQSLANTVPARVSVNVDGSIVLIGFSSAATAGLLFNFSLQ